MPQKPSRLCRRIVVVSLMLISALPFQPAQAGQADGHLAGRVVDSAGTAMSGAKITATDPQSGVQEGAVADKNGRYGLAVPIGRYDLEVSGTSAGAALAWRVHVDVSADTNRDIMAVRQGVRFNATVKTSGGAPIPNTWVRLDDPGLKTDSAGQVSLRTAPATYRLIVHNDNLRISVDGFRLDADTTRDLVIPKVPVEINVTDSAGHTVDDADISLSSSDTDAPFELIPGKKTAASNGIDVRADASGHVSFDALPTTDPVQLRIQPPKGSPLSPTTLTVDPIIGPRRIDVVLARSVPMSGTIRNADGTIPGGWVGISLNDADGHSAGDGDLAPDGTFTLTAPSGTYDLVLSGSHYASEEDEEGSQHDGYWFNARVDDFHHTGNETVDLRLPFTPARLAVVDDLGHPIAGEVDTYSQTTSPVELYSGGAGKAQISNSWRLDADGTAPLLTLPGQPVNIGVTLDSGVDTGASITATPVGNTLTATLPSRTTAPTFPVRFLSQWDGQPTCAPFTVRGDEDGIDRELDWYANCTLNLPAGRYHLSTSDTGWGGSGETTLEWSWIDADYTVTGPATLNLQIPWSRVRVDIVDGDGNPLPGALTMDSSTEPVDLGSGVEGRATVSNQYRDLGPGESSFDAPLIGPSTFTGTFTSDTAPYRLLYSGLPLSPGGHVTIAYPTGEPNLPGPTTATDDDGPTTGHGEDSPEPPDPPANSATIRDSSPSGYWALSTDGRVYNFGAAGHLGDGTTGAVDLEPTPSGKGYWVLNRNGRIQAFGDATKLGDVDLGPLAQRETPVSLSATPTGKGYWVFTNRGRAIAFGDAPHLGDVSNVTLNGPVLGSVATPSGNGYYMVASDGGIFTFGDAKFLGSMGGNKLNAPVQSLVPDADGKGYWLVASDGGIFAFDAPFKGSLGAVKLNKPVVGMVRYGDGYLMVGADGGIFNFSNLPFSGSLGDKPPASPVVAVAAMPFG